MIAFKFLNFTIQRDHNSYHDNTSSAKLYFLHEKKKRDWHRLRFIVPARKYGWVIHQNLFAQANQDSIFLHAGGLKKDWATSIKE